MSDQLSLRIKLGDEQAFKLLLRRYHVRLCGFSNTCLNHTEEAPEEVLDVFIKIWVGREDLGPEESLNVYLFKITQNISINKLHLRKLNRRIMRFYYSFNT